MTYFSMSIDTEDNLHWILQREKVNLSLLQFHRDWSESNTRYRVSHPGSHDQSRKQVIRLRIRRIYSSGLHKNFRHLLATRTKIYPLASSRFLISLSKIKGADVNGVLFFEQDLRAYFYSLQLQKKRFSKIYKIIRSRRSWKRRVEYKDVV